MALKIYTKTGDKGTTSLIGGTRVPKSHLRIEAYGTVDELNAHLGLCKDVLGDTHSAAALKKIQDELFTIGASLACDLGKETKLHIPDIPDTAIDFLEKEIDLMNEVLSPMKFFILPGGHSTISFLHIARCVCRRAERCCVRLDAEQEPVPPVILRYLNRLSDYLFVLSRYAGHLLKVEDTPWKAKGNNP